MKIGTIIIAIFFIVALLGSIAGVSYYYLRSIEVVEARVFEHLETAVHSRAHHIESFLGEKKILAKNLALIGKVERLLSASESDSDYNTKKIAVIERLQKTMNHVEGIKSIGVMDENNILIASTNQELVGWDYSDTVFFKENPEKETMIQFVYDSSLDLVVLSTVSPIKDSSGGYLGMIGMVFDSEIFYEITLDKVGIGETGETYLINRDSYTITPLLFEEDAPLKFRIDSINSRNCLSMFFNVEGVEEHIGHEPVNVFLDYRGEKVIGAHYALKEFDLCLLAEIDESEILDEQKQFFQRVSFLIIIVITGLSTLIGFFFGRFVDKTVVLRKYKKRL